jgi:hypothetical protein
MVEEVLVGGPVLDQEVPFQAGVVVDCDSVGFPLKYFMI